MLISRNARIVTESADAEYPAQPAMISTPYGRGRVIPSVITSMASVRANRLHRNTSRCRQRRNTLLAGAGQAARAAYLLCEHLASVRCDPLAIRITARPQPPTGPGRRLRGPGQPASRLSRHLVVQCPMMR
jgi:hypothetical protein